MIGKGFGSAFDPRWRSKFYSIFVGNLHPLSSRGALWKIFKNFGIIADIFIPSSRRRTSPAKSKYAFVRFKTKEEAARAIEQGNGILLDNHRLVVNNAVSVSKHEVPNFQNPWRAGALGDDGRKSNVSVTQNRPYSVEQGPIKSAANDNILLPSISVDWLLKSAVGTLRVPLCSSGTSLSEIAEGLSSQGLNVSLAPISNVNILISFDNVEVRDLYLGQFCDLFSIWFHSLIPWSEQMVERIHQVWVKIEEIPLALWHQDFFFSLGNDWGKMIELAEVTADRSNLTAAWLLVEVTSCRNIPETIQGIANGLCYKAPVTIVAESSVPKPCYGWPEFVSSPSSVSLDLSSCEKLNQVGEQIDDKLGKVGESADDIVLDGVAVEGDVSSTPTIIEDCVGPLDLVPFEGVSSLFISPCWDSLGQQHAHGDNLSLQISSQSVKPGSLVVDFCAYKPLHISLPTADKVSLKRSLSDRFCNKKDGFGGLFQGLVDLGSTHDWSWLRKPMSRRAKVGHKADVVFRHVLDTQDEGLPNSVQDEDSSFSVLRDEAHHSLEFKRLMEIDKSSFELELRREAEETLKVGKMLGLAFQEDDEAVLNILMEDEREAMNVISG